MLATITDQVENVEENLVLFFFLSTTSFIEYFHFVCKSSKKPNFLATSTGGRGGNPKSVLKRFQTKDSLEVENINDNGKREQR